MTLKYVRKTEIGPLKRNDDEAWYVPLSTAVRDNRESRCRIVLEVEEEDGNGKFYWHIHHEKLFEKATEPIETRREYIRRNKDQTEIRLKWMTPIVGPLPDGFEELYDKYANRTDAVFISPEMERLHRREHPECPWLKHPGNLLEY